LPVSQSIPKRGTRIYPRAKTRATAFEGSEGQRGKGGGRLLIRRFQEVPSNRGVLGGGGKRQSESYCWVKTDVTSSRKGSQVP